jgi:chromosome segregation ATPase
MRNDLKSDNQVIVYGNDKWTHRQVENQLNRDWASFKRSKADLDTKERLLEAKRTALHEKREQLASMQEIRDTLKVELATMEAELQTVRVAQVRSDNHFDDSRLSKIKAGVENLRKRIAQEKRTLEVAAEFSNGPVRPDAKAEKDIFKEIDSHFGKPESKKVAVGED